MINNLLTLLLRKGAQDEGKTIKKAMYRTIFGKVYCRGGLVK